MIYNTNYSAWVAYSILSVLMWITFIVLTMWMLASVVPINIYDTMSDDTETFVFKIKLKLYLIVNFVFLIGYCCVKMDILLRKPSIRDQIRKCLTNRWNRAHYVWFSSRPAPVKNSRTEVAGDPDVFPRSVLDAPPLFPFQLPSTPSVPSCPPVGKWAGLTLC